MKAERKYNYMQLYLGLTNYHGDLKYVKGVTQDEELTNRKILNFAER